MVTRQANQQFSERQHQHQLRQPGLQRDSKHEEEAVVADGDGSNCTRNEKLYCENDKNNSNKSTIDNKERTISEITSNNLKIDNKRQEIARNKEQSSLPVEWEKVDIADGSIGESTQCSDVEEEEEEEEDYELENEEEGEYEVDEIETEEEDNNDFQNKEVDNNQVKTDDRWIKKKVVTTRVQRETRFGTKNGDSGQSEIVPHLDETTFGEVCITNSRHVHVGNTNFYKGPVTIKQFVYTNAYPILDKDDTDGSSSARVSDINTNVPIVKNYSNEPILASHRDYERVTKWLWTWRCAAILSVLALSLVTVVTVASVLMSNKGEGLPNKVPESPGSGGEADLPGDSVRIIERESWNAQPPAKDLIKLEITPTPYVIISHTATASCETQSTCVLRVRLIQTFHIESFGWDDIGYNFLVGGDGMAYLARGWDFAGAHAFGYNFNSIGISFIGTFNDVAPSKVQLQAAQRLIQLGVNISKIAPTYKLLGHRQVSKTLSPGDQLYKILQTWSHWSPYPPPQSNRATTNNVLHTAAFLPIFLIVFTDFLLLCRLTARKIFDPLINGITRTYNYNYIILLVYFNNNDKIQTIK